LQIQQVHYFMALCEELNFTCAARRCGISQPSLSNAISALERELGGALFHRKPSIALTALGSGRSAEYLSPANAAPPLA
jgi:DNA-binding transcriptional LysR family regulator